MMVLNEIGKNAFSSLLHNHAEHIVLKSKVEFKSFAKRLDRLEERLDSWQPTMTA
ncbi:MAG: hypothetical protein Ta2F_17920 [Termitinemataceae bacterium]|nr:MAG: hypothetical protein Ta2F_17920 [Termitinemataceae bacterium]